MRYHHLGIPTDLPREGEEHLERYGIHCTDHEANPFGIQWMRYDEDCPLPARELFTLALSSYASRSDRRATPWRAG